MTRTNSRIAALIALALVAIAFVALGGLSWIVEDGNVQGLLTDTGAVGPIIFVVVMWVTQPFGVPGFVYMAPAGMVWPFPLAIALSWIGNMGSSYLGFAFARWVARDWVKARIPPRMHGFDARLAEGGLTPIVGLRLVFGQLPPADWLLGVTRVGTPTFLLGTGIGIIPGAVVAVVAGGGLIRFLLNLPAATAVSAVAALAIGAAGLMLWRRHRRGGRPVGRPHSDQSPA